MPTENYLEQIIPSCIPVLNAEAVSQAKGNINLSALCRKGLAFFPILQAE